MGSAQPPGARAAGVEPGPGAGVGGGGGGPGGAGARGAFLLVVALILGVVLLQEFDSAPFSERVVTGESPTTTRRSPSVSVLPTPSTRAVRPPDQVKVLPANGTSTSGLGGRTGTYLSGNGYNALAPIDATRDVATSQVQFKPDFEPEARAVAQLLQLPASAVVRMEDAPPVPDTREADIIVVIGADLRLPGDTTTTSRRL